MRREPIEHLKYTKSAKNILKGFVDALSSSLDREFPYVTEWQELNSLFTNKYFKKPFILILDEFDALEEKFINQFANIFRKMYHARATVQKDIRSKYMLHGLALIGVRSVLGIENVTGSPFNVQRSVRIPNLT
ncbi:MAG: hypothetical protein B6244_07265, partial [Candidatus Cloacimonetes bacterium 4572_55]